MYSRFLKNFFAFSAILLGTVFLTNFFVDPYGLRKQGGRVNNDRVVKAIRVNHLRPNIVLLGSSGVARGLNPEHPTLTKQGKTYNLGILGANIYELLRYFQHATAAESLDTAVVSLDFYAFNGIRDVRPGFSESRLENQSIAPEDLFGLFFSIDSLKLVFNADKRGRYFHKNGTYAHDIEPEERQSIFATELLEDFSREEEMYWEYQFSQENISYFSEMVTVAQAENVDLKPFIPPMHVTLFYSAMFSERWSLYQQWMKEVVAVHPVWDFSGCNSVTSEMISPEMKNYEDPSHYTYKVGNLLIKQMFEELSTKEAGSFGVYVTSDNVDAHLKSVKAQCDRWQQENPEIVSWLKELDLNGRIIASSQKAN
ncbi:hypothetical protein [Sphaerothrix gracilis]|uniref:hypothetical protein n=1 Tax=Sphaerothrix gracilis TaxID=3151835 RepID=UPI0031FE0C27